MKKVFFVLCFFCCCTTKWCVGQEMFEEPKSNFITSFPFKQFTGGVMIVRAKLGNIPDTLNFILDTGSGGISLDSSTCIEFNIKPVPTDTTINGIGGFRKVPFIFDQTLFLPGLQVNHLNFHVNNYDVLTSVYGEKVDGIIGYSFFSRYIVSVNFDSSTIQIYNPGKFNYPSGGYILHPIFTALPIQWLTIKDKKKIGSNFYFDTGAGICFLLSKQFVNDSSFLLSRRKPVLTQAQGMAGRLQMDLTVIKELKIGPYKFKKVPTYIYNDVYNVTSFPFIGGLVGNDLLRRFNLIFNYPKREIHILPNSHFIESFDYAYTGLGIYFENGKIIVGDVIENSPAAKAKLLAGDEIIGVGANFSHNITAYKNLLQVPNQMIKILIKRNNEIIFLSIKTESIK